jgi:excisionase family DNA binding protein
VSSITSQYPRYLTPQEAADVTRESRKTIYRRIAAGDLAAVRLGDRQRGPLRISLVDLDAYLERNREPVAS